MSKSEYEATNYVKECADAVFDGVLTNDKTYTNYWFRKLQLSIKKLETRLIAKGDLE